MARVRISSDVLRWARDRAGVSADELAAKFKNYPAWENGESGPTQRQLDDLASLLNLPVGMFYLPAPPREQLPLPDFRRMADAPSIRPSTELIDTLHIYQRRQEWYRYYLIASGATPLDFVGSSDTKDEAEVVAGRIRSRLDLEDASRSDASNFDEFSRAFLRSARDVGILVTINGVVGNNTHRALDPQEFRGFAIADPYAPLVFINNADTKAGQIFTLAHEIAHIWLGKSGISFVQASDLPERYGPDRAVEKWCNAIAAEILVPIATLRKMALGETLEEAKAKVAKRFKVSTLVALRRLKDIGFIDADAFSAAYAVELAFLKRQSAKRKESGKGGDFYNNMGARVDPRFAAAVIGSTIEGRTLMGDALNLLGIGNTHVFHEEARRLGVVA